MSYIVRFGFTGDVRADDMAAAKAAVRTMAIRVAASEDAAEKMVFSRSEDGVYAYLTQEESDADETGSQAFAVISDEDEA